MTLDLGYPVIGDLPNPDLSIVMMYGRFLVERQKSAKHVSLFGYRLEEWCDLKGKVFGLVPSSPGFEYALRLGYIRAEMGSAGWLGISKREGVPKWSLATVAEEFVKRYRDRIAEIRDDGTSFSSLLKKGTDRSVHSHVLT